MAAVSAFVFMGIFMCVEVQAQFRVPVTYYDFHTDGSNPDFGREAFCSSLSGQLYAQTGQSSATIIKGWFGATLDSDKKPVSNAALPEVTRLGDKVSHVNKWFRPWQSGDTTVYFRTSVSAIITPIDTEIVPFVMDGDTLWAETTFTYDTAVTLVRLDTLHNDTCFKNVTIPGSIQFVQNGTGYTGSITSPLNGMGFGAEGSMVSCVIDTPTNTTSNDGLTMELHNSFTYHGGETLMLGADDAAWAFVNGQLCLDNGGWHPYATASLSLDSLGLVVGQQYPIDIFWIDRWWGSSLNIQTNFEFVTTGTHPSTNTYPAVGTQEIVVGKNIRFLVPKGTYSMDINVFDLKGKKISHTFVNNSAQADRKVIANTFPRQGIVIVKMACRDFKGKELATIVNCIGTVR